MMPRIAAAAVMFAVSTSLAHSQGSDGALRVESLPPPVAAVSHEVVLVRVAGPWSSEGRNGLSRIVATITGGKLSLYVQWLADGNNRVVETRELPGAADAPQLALATIRTERDADGTVLYMDAPEDEQGFQETYVLIIGAPGEARFGPATN